MHSTSSYTTYMMYKNSKISMHIAILLRPYDAYYIFDSGVSIQTRMGKGHLHNI